MKIDLLIDRLKSLKTSKLDDFVDRLHYLYTTLMLVFFVFVVGMQQTFKTSLNCKVDANWPDQWTDYSNNYCYTIGTYHTKNGSNFDGKREKIHVDYYHWVPYALAVQALSFCIPHLVYLFLASFTLPGLNLQNILKRCCNASTKKESDLDEETAEIANSIYLYTALPRNNHKSKSLGKSVAYSYILSKLLNLANVAFNIYLLNQFIGMGNTNWAFTIVQNAYNHVYWDQTGFFPRITFCDLPIKGIGQQRVHTVQCLLMINILIEKAYIIIYFWFLALFIMTFINLFWSIWTSLIHARAPLNMFAKPSFEGEYRKYLEFCGGFMSKNGALLIRFVNEHAGSVMAHKLVESLAILWMEKTYPELTAVQYGSDDWSNSGEA